MTDRRSAMKVVTIALPAGSASILKGYAAYGIVGDTIEEAAAYLPMRALCDIVATPGFHHLLEAVKEDARERRTKPK